MDSRQPKRASRKASGKGKPAITIIVQKLMLPPGTTPESFLRVLEQIATGNIEVKFECLETV